MVQILKIWSLHWNLVSEANFFYRISPIVLQRQVICWISAASKPITGCHFGGKSSGAHLELLRHFSFGFIFLNCNLKRSPRSLSSARKHDISLPKSNATLNVPLNVTIDLASCRWRRRQRIPERGSHFTFILHSRRILIKSDQINRGRDLYLEPEAIAQFCGQLYLLKDDQYHTRTVCFI